MKTQKKILSLLFFIVTSNVMIFAQDVTVINDSIESTFSSDCSDDPYLSNVHWYRKKILIDNRAATGKEIRNMMQRSSSESYAIYSKGRKLQTTGIVLLVVGGGLLVGGFVCASVASTISSDRGHYYFDDDFYDSGYFDNEWWAAGSILTLAGGAGVATGIPLLVTGSVLKKRAIRNFGKNYLSDEPVKRENQIQFNLNVNKNGVGLAIVF